MLELEYLYDPSVAERLAVHLLVFLAGHHSVDAALHFEGEVVRREYYLESIIDVDIFEEHRHFPADVLADSDVEVSALCQKF